MERAQPKPGAVDVNATWRPSALIAAPLDGPSAWLPSAAVLTLSKVDACGAADALVPVSASNSVTPKQTPDTPAALVMFPLRSPWTFLPRPHAEGPLRGKRTTRYRVNPP